MIQIPQPVAPPPRRVASILLVDDRSENLLVLEAILEPLGQRLVSVTSGEDALRAAEHEEFAAILLDLMMPGLDGFETARRLKELPRARHVPIIVLTANDADAEWVRRAYGVGAADYIVKPCNPLVLSAKVSVFVELFLRGVESREREEARAQEEARRRAAEDASRLKDEFLATVSHELRTPLTAILGWAAALQRRVRDEAAVTRGLQVIERNARAQAKLIDDILDVSRIITGKLRLEAHRIDLDRLIHETVEVVRPSTDAKGIEITVSIEGGFSTVLGDEDRLRQIFWNLFSNAVKFTPPGGRIGVAVRSELDEVVVEVCDTGRGIEREFLPHVFDRFRQADASSTRVYGGLGLGLSIVRHLVELHGGDVSVSSDGAGRGATFVVRLPARPSSLPRMPDAPSCHSEAELPLPARQVPSLAGARVLVVEDDDDARELVVSVLGREGALVRPAGSALEGLDALAEFSPDVVVCDVGMPGRDGYWFVRRLLELRPGLPALALTAYARVSDAERALAEGFTKHLAKPADPDDLLGAVASLLPAGERRASRPG